MPLIRTDKLVECVHLSKCTLSLQLTARVFDKKTNQETDLPLPIQILVDDVNDNAPQFEGALQFVVLEHSPVGEEHGRRVTVDILAVFDRLCGRKIINLMVLFCTPKGLWWGRSTPQTGIKETPSTSRSGILF